MASFVVVALVVYIQKCITFMWVKLFKFKVSDFYMFRKIDQSADAKLEPGVLGSGGALEKETSRSSFPEP